MSTPITYVDYTATAAQTDFAFSFPYLEDEHVIVEIDGVQQTIGADEDYTVQTSPTKKIVLNVAATGGEIVRVRRISDPATDLVDFVNGSVLTESELDRAYLHNRYLAEESAEQNDVSLRIKQGDTNWDALNKRIKNVADPSEEQDAATKNYVDGVIGDAVLGTVPDDSITYAKLQDAVGNNVLLGNDNGAGEEIQELNATEVRTILNVEDGANNFSLADNAVTSAKISDTDTTFKVATSEVTVNDGQGAVDFRVESDSADNLLLCDASGDKVGIGTVPSVYKLDVQGNTTSGNNSSVTNIHASADGAEAVLLVKNDSATGEGARLALFNSNTSSYPNANKAAFVLESATPGLCVCFNTDAGTTQATFKFLSDSNAFFISNTSSVPATPTGGGVLYVEGGSLKYKGSSGTITTLGTP